MSDRLPGFHARYYTWKLRLTITSLQACQLEINDKMALKGHYRLLLQCKAILLVRLSGLKKKVRASGEYQAHYYFKPIFDPHSLGI